MSETKNKRYLWGIVFLTIGLSLLTLVSAFTLVDIYAPTASVKLDLKEIWGAELEVGQYFTVVDNKSHEVIDKISRQVYPGDQFISEDNKKYEVIEIDGNKAIAKMLGKADGVVWKPEWDEIAASVAPDTTSAIGDNKSQVGIYYTHSDESYVPTDGSESIPGKGGIMKVGDSLARQLKENGVTVTEDKTPHEPHDSAAYHRSRKTAVQLLKQQPVALIDVHRDGVPDPNFYRDNIDGENVTKVRLVVGRQNPNMKTNLDFAKKVKAYIDKKKPGLIRGIFLAKGNYNQDLGPKAMLIEVGTHTNSRERAEGGAALFAEALPKVLNLQKAQQNPGITNFVSDKAQSRSGWSTVAWVLGIVLIGIAAFLFISTGSVKGVKSKLGELKKTEFANFLGRGQAKKEDKEKTIAKIDSKAKDDDRLDE